MSELVKTFAELLQQFALSVDIVNQGTFNRVRDYVVDYMKNELEAAYFGLMTRSIIDGQPGLQTTWSSVDQGSATTIRTSEGYTRQVSLAFDQRRPLWVVAEDDGTPLRDVPDSTGYVDLWSGTTDLPRYVPPVDEPMKTSIMLPLVRAGRPLGVIYLESTAHVEATAVAKKELQTLAEAIAILIELRDANKTQAEGTEKAVGQLARFLGTAKFPRLTKPNLFLASPDDADMHVLGVIKETLAEFDSQVTVFDWQEIADAGAITAQIADRIVRSRYGICYFSEPAPRMGDTSTSTIPTSSSRPACSTHSSTRPTRRRPGGSRCARTTPRRPRSTSPTSASSGCRATSRANSTRIGSGPRSRGG